MAAHTRLLIIPAVLFFGTAVSCNASTPPDKKPQTARQSPARSTQQTSFTPTQPHLIEDTAYGIPYGTVTIPAGWAFNGGVIHAETCAVSGPSAAYALQSPNGLYGFIVAPELVSMATNDRSVLARMQQQGCQQNASASAADFIRTMFLSHLSLQNMRVVKVGPTQSLQPAAERIRQQQQQFAAMAPTAQFVQHQTSVDTADVKVSFESHGRQMDGLAAAVVLCEDSRMAFPGQPAVQQRRCTAKVLAFEFSPAGEIDKTVQTKFAPFQQDPAWTRYYQHVANNQLAQNANAIQQNRDAQIARGNALMEAQRKRFQAGQAAARASAEGLHESSQAAAAHNGDYNDFTNGQTGQTVRASNQYSNTYVDSHRNRHAPDQSGRHSRCRLVIHGAALQIADPDTYLRRKRISKRALCSQTSSASYRPCLQAGVQVRWVSLHWRPATHSLRGRAE